MYCTKKYIGMTKVLVPIDGSKESHQAFEYACETISPDTVVLLHVITPSSLYSHNADPGMYTEAMYEAQKERAEGLFETLRENIDIDPKIKIETIIDVGRPANKIVTFADENDVDHIVMGSKGRDGAARVLLGSVAETVVRRATVPTTVVR